MSVKARIEFYKLLEVMYWSQGDELPVICSHAALNGYKSLEESDVRDTHRRWARYYLSRQSINMSDEEARIIANSRGLVGIVLHGGRLPGGIAKKQMDSARGNDQLRDISVKLIMSNIFQFVRAVDHKMAWDTLCIGSDMDGVIVPFKIYPNYTRISDLANHCFQFFSRPLDLNEIGLDRGMIKELMYGYDPEELTEKLMSKNALNFIKRYFHDDYLGRELPGPV